jgi:hypothetical protein
VTDFDSMSDDEIRAWAEAERAKSRAQFAGQPLPEISAVKKADYPHWKFQGYDFSLRPGGGIGIWRSIGQRPIRGSIVGLRQSGGSIVLDVTLPDSTVWSLTRVTGEPWATTTQQLSLAVPDILVDVVATPTTPPGQPEQWVVRTKRVNEIEGLIT